MAIISIANSKGGCGKTTISVNLAAELNGTLVDIDPQASSCSAGAHSQIEIVSLPLHDKSRIPEFINRVRNLAERGHVIVDCPPSLADATRSTLMVADLCLVPITPSPLDLRAAQQALEAWQAMRDWRNGLPDVLLVPNRVDLRTRQGRDIAGILSGLGSRVAPSIGYRMAFVDAAAKGLSVGEFAPGSLASSEIRALALTVEARIAAAEASHEVPSVPANKTTDPATAEESADSKQERPLPAAERPASAGSGLLSRLLSWG